MARYRLTESRLRGMIREAVIDAINEAWQDDYNSAMDKAEYENNMAAYKGKPWYKRAFATLTGRRPKDPNPNVDLNTLLNQYTTSYNNERGFAHSYPDGTKGQLRMSYSNDKDDTRYQPVLDFKHQDTVGGGIRGNRIAHDPEGNEREWGLAYPWTEIGYTGWPENSEPHNGGMAHGDINQINKEREHVMNVIRNRQQRIR